jgi:hypothetical protein
VCVDGEWKAKCNHCGKKLSAISKNGTTHLKSYPLNNKKLGDKIQSNLRFGTTEKGAMTVENHMFDQEVARKALYTHCPLLITMVFVSLLVPATFI